MPASAVEWPVVLGVIAGSVNPVGVDDDAICDDDGNNSKSCVEAARIVPEDPVSSAAVEADARLVNSGPELSEPGAVVAVEMAPEDSTKDAA